MRLETSLLIPEKFESTTSSDPNELNLTQQDSGEKQANIQQYTTSSCNTNRHCLWYESVYVTVIIASDRFQVLYNIKPIDGLTGEPENLPMGVVIAYISL